MSFQTELDATARGLAKVAVLGTSTLTSDELDIALYARATVLDLCRLVVRDLTGLQEQGLRPTLADLETHAVNAFYKALRGHQPVPAVKAPSEVLSTGTSSSTGEAWRDVTRHALQAHHLWQTGRLPTQEPDVAWAGMLDTAALASVVAELEAELARAAEALEGRMRDAENLAKAATSGLGTAAHAVAVLADSGPLAPSGPEPIAAVRRIVVPVSSPEDAAQAQEQLAALLRTANHVSPERLALITLGHQRAIEAALATWRLDDGAVDEQLRTALSDHRDLLAEATGRRWANASIGVTDNRPVHQANVLRQHLQPDDPILVGIGADAALRRQFVHAVADTTMALSEVTDAHIRTGAWLQPILKEGRFLWWPAKSLDQVPRPTQALRAAAIHAVHLQASTVDPREALQRILGRLASDRDATAHHRTGARHALAPAPRAPLLPHSITARPLRPGIPPRPVAPFYVERQIRR